MEYQPIIGLEIHSELKTETKMFCSCENNSEETRPNFNICPICLGHPGTLPVINEEAVKKVIKTGIALNCEIPELSKFDRKNYFYPDLPKGYQISQYDAPLCLGGYLDLPNNPRIFENNLSSFEENSRNSSSSFEENSRRIHIRRIHLEEDTGRLLHMTYDNDNDDDKSHSHQSSYSLVDFNRAGIPLMEIVTEPDITSAKEARIFAEELQLILRYLDVSNADMEKGEMRVEVNISLSNPSRITSNKSRITNVPRIEPNVSRIILKDESYKLMGLLFEIHNKLGSIYKEKNYQEAIEEILKRENINYEREKNIKLKFENLEVSDFFVDFVIDNKIALEIKAKPFVSNDDIRQASRYIKSLNLPLAIIINFKHQKLESKRVVNPAFENNLSSFVENSRFEKHSGTFEENSFERDSGTFEENSRNLGTKVEIKNLNSFRVVERAIDYEIKRQTEILGTGGKIIQETRGWDDVRGRSFSQRIKEEAHDYRYFPEPDLPPINISKMTLWGVAKGNRKNQISKTMVELPQSKRERFKKEYRLQEKEIEVLVKEKDLASYFEKCAEETQLWMRDRKISETKKYELFKIMANYLLSDLKGLMTKESVDFKNLKITPENFAELILMLYSKEISSRVGKDVLLVMLETGGDPSNIVGERNLKQVSGKKEIKNIVQKIIEKNQKAVEDYKKGKQNAIQFLVGQVLRETKGRANPEETRKIIQEILQN